VRSSGVGKNLQDHPACATAYECIKPVSLASAESFSNLMRYMISKKGPLTSNVAEAGAFVKTSSRAQMPDLQFHFGVGYFVEHGFQQIKGHAFTMGPTLLHPFSRGDIRMRSSNPLDAPAIRANYLSDSRDMDVMLEASSFPASWRRPRPSTAIAAWNSTLALWSKMTPLCAHTSPNLLRHSTIPLAHAGWEMTAWQLWIQSCAFTALKACAWWMHRSCRPWSAKYECANDHDC